MIAQAPRRPQPRSQVAPHHPHAADKDDTLARVIAAHVSAAPSLTSAQRACLAAVLLPDRRQETAAGSQGAA